MKFSCRIDGDIIVCTLTPDRSLSHATLCFSGMAPMEPASGATLQYSLGSYTELALPDISEGQAHEIQVRYVGGYRPANRAWMPLGPYLRVDGQAIPLPPVPFGRRPVQYKATEHFHGLPIAPQPTHWRPAECGSVAVDGFDISGDALAATAELAERHKLPFKGSFPVEIERRDLPPDAYLLTISENKVCIAASSYGGEFYAGVTLLTLLQNGPLPCGEIVDEPRFAWRGQHLDTARHYYEPRTIMALLDLMAMLKLNRFHWHFSDDEAFRIELDALPELAQKTAFRGEGQTLPGLFTGETCQGGTYSKKTVRQIIDHAAKLNIEVMPEIETPAHALALTTVYPDTRDPGDNGQEKSVQGYARNALNPAMPKTWELLDILIGEIADLFPFDRLHLGCDELPTDTWMSSPKARALMAEHGLETTHDLQGWTMAKLAARVVALGKAPAAWEEAALGSNGGIGHGALLFSWTGQGPGLDAARSGYDVIMTPAQHVYLDMAHTDDVDDWGASWAAFVDLPDTINWDPVPDATLAGNILGVQGAFWSEFTTRDEDLWPMLMPRMLGVSMMAWQRENVTTDALFALAARYAVNAHGRLALGAKS
ncbi:MAG: beta-N-acetylhexosaminidase [Pseudomonadota bacterium]